MPDPHRPHDPHAPISLSDLLRNPDNANLGTDAGRAALANGIDEVGFLDGGVMSADNVVLSGNHRLDEAVKRGIEPIIIDVDGSRPVFLRRPNVQSGTPEAEKIALLANQVPKLNYNPDRQRINERIIEMQIVPAQVAFTVEELTVVPYVEQPAPPPLPVVSHVERPVVPASPASVESGESPALSTVEGKGSDPDRTNQKIARVNTVMVECPNEQGQERVYQMLLQLLQGEDGFKVSLGTL